MSKTLDLVNTETILFGKRRQKKSNPLPDSLREGNIAIVPPFTANGGTIVSNMLIEM